MQRFYSSVRRLSLSLAVLYATFAAAQPLSAQTAGSNPVKRSGKYAVELRVPAGGLFAGEETDVEFRVTDASQDDPVLGSPPIVNAKVAANVTMPSMPAMPGQTPKTHSEGVPGDYGVILYFPHGGDYRLDLKITPPGGEAFRVSFTLPVEDAAPGRKPKPSPYVLEVTASPARPKAGEPTQLTVLVRRRDDKQVVQEFETVHEMKMHLIVVAANLGLFSHEHPTPGPDGKFTLTYTFPTAGNYRLFADVAPRGAGSQVLMQPLTVSGPPTSDSFRLDPSQPARAVVNGADVRMKTGPDALVAGKALPLTFTLQAEGTGAPLTDIQPWLGAAAHLILIHQDATTFVHSHPDESDPNNGKQGSITFLARFPKPGIYRGWLQFQRDGQVLTAPFVVKAKEGKR